MNIQFVDKDQIWAEEQTNYWFLVNGDPYAIADQNGRLTLLDSEGYPIDSCNDHERIMDALKPVYEKHIHD